MMALERFKVPYFQRLQEAMIGGLIDHHLELLEDDQTGSVVLKSFARGDGGDGGGAARLRAAV